MTITPIYQVDAFTNELFSGNPAAVCPLDAWLSNDLMQNIAMENNLSETAFLVKNKNGYHIRWFTPAAELELCGHATLAAAHVVFEFLKPDLETISFESASGPLRVWKEDEMLCLNFPAIERTLCKPPKALEEAFDVPILECYDSMDYMLVIESQEQLETMNIKVDLLYGLKNRGVIVTAPGINVDFVSRFFVPKHQITEDPVTGSAHCALVPYWAKRLNQTHFHAKQLSKRGGEIFCELKGDRVILKGKTKPYMIGAITLALETTVN